MCGSRSVVGHRVRLVTVVELWLVGVKFYIVCVIAIMEMISRKVTGQPA